MSGRPQWRCVQTSVCSAQLKYAKNTNTQISSKLQWRRAQKRVCLMSFLWPTSLYCVSSTLEQQMHFDLDVTLWLSCSSWPGEQQFCPYSLLLGSLSSEMYIFAFVQIFMHCWLCTVRTKDYISQLVEPHVWPDHVFFSNFQSWPSPVALKQSNHI